ncbi:MAG: TRAP transporter large permease subunit, partial [Amylibacter sp.]|nr:TRAP transporter large permease subunit [Amylibacter sp.]
MELVFLAVLVILMATALGSGYPVAFSLPGASILTILLAAVCGYIFAGNTDAFFAQGGPSQWLSAGVTNLRGVYWEPERDTLIAIPLFIFMGIMLQRSRIAEDLLITMAQLFGPVPGGLGISVVFVGALLAATTGIVGATVVAMGLISLPAMLRNNYSQSLATGTIAASGTLGQIIPPSIVLIILADQLASAADQAGTIRKSLYKEATGELTMPSTFDVVSTSAGEMFLGAFVPGIVLVGLYMAYILIAAFLRPGIAPPVPFSGNFDRAFAVKVVVSLVPPLLLIFLVLGSIVGGIATVNQAGAIGAAGALIMAGYRLHDGQPRAYWPALLAIASLLALVAIMSTFDTNIKNVKTSQDALGVTLAIIASLTLIFALIWSGWRAFKIENTLEGVMIETAKTTSLVFIILLGAAMLTAAFRAFGGEELVRHFLEGLPGGFWFKFIVVMSVIFILGFFLDFIEIAVVVVPIVAPILLADPEANVTAVWLGVMIGLNIQTSFLTPPFGFALFYLRGVAPAVVKTIQMYKGVVPFIGLQLLALVIVAWSPPLVNYLPNRVSLLSDNAPPPRNPKLSYCVDQYVGQQIALHGASLIEGANAAQSIDLSILPRKLAKNVSSSFDSVAIALDELVAAKNASEMTNAASVEFKPIHTDVRAIQRDMRRIDESIEELTIILERTRDDEDGNKAKALNERIARLTTDRDAIGEGIPASWDTT